VREYVIDFNGERAAARAGYSAHTANEQASGLLTRPSVIAAINELRDKQAQRMLVSAENVLDELAIVGFSDIRAYWPEPGERLDITRLDRRLTAAIAQIDIDETLIPGEDGGPPQLLRRRTKLKLHNKVTALEKLALHLGLFDHAEKDSLVDRVRKMTPQERVARLEQIMKIARERYGPQIEHEEAKQRERKDGSPDRAQD
jgi:phage terminase small subunit